MAKITLDADTFRALASSTRLTVLKALDERRKTLTELSRDLSLNKATVHEHMQLLTAAGLVRKRDDEGRKWIYYELTWTGQRILHPEATTTFSLLLGLSVAAAGGGVAMLGRALGWWFAQSHATSFSHGEVSQDSAPMAAQANDTSAASASSGPSSGASPAYGNGTQMDRGLSAPQPEVTSPGHHGTYFFDDGGWIAIALIATCLLFLVLAWALRRKLKPEPLDPDSADAAERTPFG